MKISDLKAQTGKVFLQAKIDSLQDARDTNNGKVQNGVISDESGKIGLTLWNADVGKFRIGDNIAIENGYVGAPYKGELSVGAGKYGKVTRV